MLMCCSLSASYAFRKIESSYGNFELMTQVYFFAGFFDEEALHVLIIARIFRHA